MVQMTLPVAEIFATWQGEGPHAGKRCSFLRLGLCNLSCEWCDTPYTWDREHFDLDVECPPMSSGDILDAIEKHGTDLLIVTGGEPLIWAEAAPLIDVAHAWALRMDIETNGTLHPPLWADTVRLFSVSPKINTHDPEQRRVRIPVLKEWVALENAVFKFVCTDPEDVFRSADLVDGLDVPAERVWIMPEGATRNRLLANALAVAEPTADFGFNLTLRQHILIYNDERGH